MIHARRESPLFVLFALSAFALAAASAPVYAQSGADPRIGPVENGLLPPVLIKGQKAWNILDRMKFYNIPSIPMRYNYL